MNANRIRGWLLKHPKPQAVRVTTVEGDVQKITVGRNFMRCAETIAALNPELLEALDKKGEIIRADRVTDEDAQRSEAAKIPEGLKNDPKSLMLTHFADLIHRAYAHSTEIAFNKMGDLFEMLNERSAATEARLERVEGQYRRSVEDQINDAFERAEEARERNEQPQSSGNPFIDQLTSAFINGQMQRPAASNGAAKPNGKGPHA